MESRGKVEAFLAEQALKDLKKDLEKKRAARLTLPRPKRPRYQPARPSSYNPGETWKCFRQVLFMIFEKLSFLKIPKFVLILSIFKNKMFFKIKTAEGKAESASPTNVPRAFQKPPPVLTLPEPEGSLGSGSASSSFGLPNPLLQMLGSLGQIGQSGGSVSFTIQINPGVIPGMRSGSNPTLPAANPPVLPLENAKESFDPWRRVSNPPAAAKAEPKGKAKAEPKPKIKKAPKKKSPGKK